MHVHLYHGPLNCWESNDSPVDIHGEIRAYDNHLDVGRFVPSRSNTFARIAVLPADLDGGDVRNALLTIGEDAIRHAVLNDTDLTDQLLRLLENSTRYTRKRVVWTRKEKQAWVHACIHDGFEPTLRALKNTFRESRILPDPDARELLIRALEEVLDYDVVVRGLEDRTRGPLHRDFDLGAKRVDLRVREDEETREFVIEVLHPDWNAGITPIGRYPGGIDRRDFMRWAKSVWARLWCARRVRGLDENEEERQDWLALEEAGWRAMPTLEFVDPRYYDDEQLSDLEELAREIEHQADAVRIVLTDDPVDALEDWLESRS
jgi:hypothetical protein